VCQAKGPANISINIMSGRLSLASPLIKSSLETRCFIVRPIIEDVLLHNVFVRTQLFNERKADEPGQQLCQESPPSPVQIGSPKDLVPQETRGQNESQEQSTVVHTADRAQELSPQSQEDQGQLELLNLEVTEEEEAEALDFLEEKKKPFSFTLMPIREGEDSEEAVSSEHDVLHLSISSVQSGSSSSFKEATPSESHIVPHRLPFSTDDGDEQPQPQPQPQPISSFSPDNELSLNNELDSNHFSLEACSNLVITDVFQIGKDPLSLDDEEGHESTDSASGAVADEPVSGNGETVFCPASSVHDKETPSAETTDENVDDLAKIVDNLLANIREAA